MPGVRCSDRFLRVLAPLVAREARDNPHELLDEILTELQGIAGRRGLRSILADVERVAAGGALELPSRPDRNTTYAHEPA